MRIYAKKSIIAMITISLLISTTICLPLDAAAEQAVKNVPAVSKVSTIGGSDTDYAAYIKKYGSAAKPDKEISVDLTAFEAAPADYAKPVENIGGKQGKVIETTDDGYIEWPVDVEAEGLYNICIDYYSDSKIGKGSSIIRALKIDGELPFDESNSLSFSRVYT
ncbi:MAG: hypothetical protein ACYCYI_03665, partial [Saccharofermentanales bacterium]